VGGAQRSERRLSSVARPISEVPTTRPDEDLAALIERIGTALDYRVLVFDKEDLVGILSPVDITRLLTVRQTLSRS
jgi:CBS-domain-containing membrane protein